MKSKRWSRTGLREALKTKFGQLLADEERISLREARRDVGGVTHEQLEEIYESVGARLGGVDSNESVVGLAAVLEEINVHDILPALAANAQRARGE